MLVASGSNEAVLVLYRYVINLFSSTCMSFRLCLSVGRFTASTFRRAVRCRQRRRRTNDWATTWIEFFTWVAVHAL